MINKLILVLGPESTGTRWLSSVFSKHPDVEGPSGKHDDKLDKFWFSKKECDFLNAVNISSEALLVRRSIPAGIEPGKKAKFGVFQEFSQLANFCKKYNIVVQVLITTRSILPHLNSWTKSRASVDKSLVKSYIQYQMVYRYLFNWINEYRLSFLLVSLESAVYEGGEFISGVWRFLGLKPYEIAIEGNKRVNTVHYDELKSIINGSEKSKILKRGRVFSEENRYSELFFFDENTFEQVCDFSYSLDLSIESTETVHLELQIQGVSLPKIVVEPNNQFQLKKELVSLARTGSLTIDVYCSKGNIEKCFVYSNLSISQKSSVTVDLDPFVLRLFSEVLSPSYMLDKITLQNANYVLSDRHRFNIISAYLVTIENIKFTRSLMIFNDIFNIISSKSQIFESSFWNTLFHRAELAINSELNYKKISEQYDYSGYEQQIRKSFEVLRPNGFATLLSDEEWLLFLSEVEVNLYRLIDLLFFYNVNSNNISDIDRIDSQILHAESKRDIIDYLQNESAVEAKILSSIRGSLEGYSMTELKRHMDDLKHQIQEEVTKTSKQLFNARLDGLHKVEEFISKFSDLEKNYQNKLSFINESVNSFRSALNISVGNFENFKVLERKKLEEYFDSELRKKDDLNEKLNISICERFNEIAVLTKELGKAKDIIRNIESSYGLEVSTFKSAVDSLKTDLSSTEKSLDEANEIRADLQSSLEHRYVELARFTERCEFLERNSKELRKNNEKLVSENLKLTVNSNLMVQLIKNKKEKLTFMQIVNLCKLKIKLSKRNYADYKCLLKSGLFDDKYYLNVNEDVRFSKSFRKDPLLHYVIFGWKELRDPNNDFSTERYLERNDDVRYSGGNPLVHFIKIGYEESRYL